MTANKKTANFPVTYIKGVGEKRAKLFEKLGVFTAYDLVTHYPREYIDFNAHTPIASTPVNGESCVVRARVTKKLIPYYGRISVFKAIVSDETGDMLIVFFNSDYSFSRLKLDREYCFYGRPEGDFLRRELHSPIFIEAEQSNMLMPRYPLTQGLSQGIISSCIKNAIDEVEFEDYFSSDFCAEYGLISFKDAIRRIHFPKTAAEYELAKRRLTFEELFLLQLGLNFFKKRSRRLTGSVMKNKPLDDFYARLPFEPTAAQMRAIKECCDDMTKAYPMKRLLQGDVGSGKTLVAAAAAYFAFLNGCQATLMAPTEILAQQHYDTFSKLLEPLGVNVLLLTGSRTGAVKKALREHIESGCADVVIGTQALIQKSTVFKNLGLVITDEQHRFGVNQRAALSSKGNEPHVLVMSATPIPRTLGLIIYGDLDISVLDEMPKGRVPIKTYAVDDSFRERLYKFILKYVNEGFQAYIVCPLIDEGISEKAAAVKYIEGLRNTCLCDVPIGLLHGKMSQSEKDAVMRDFKDNKLKVLVTTTVVEVGVDVPNAVVMIIENAEQFGLSQLHQLRGRVGRGTQQSYCVLVTNNQSDFTKQRMEIMTRTSDGFEIANDDLKLRGPGDFFGKRQHGLPRLKIADLYADMDILKITSDAARKILDDDSTLSKPENSGLLRMINKLFENFPEE